MKKYRIVSRLREYRVIDYVDDPQRIGSLMKIEFYFAQRKIFNRFWVDCRFIDFTYDYDTSYSPDLKVVEEYVRRKMNER